MNNAFDIFISYKRGKSIATANNLYFRLKNWGYTAFYDVNEMRTGNFDEQLKEYIDNAKDVFILLEEGSLDSCKTQGAWQNDWFCCEITYALQQGKNIIPVLLNGYSMPPEDFFPEKMRELAKKNAPEFSFAFFDEYIRQRIKNKDIMSKPRKMAGEKNAFIGLLLLLTLVILGLFLYNRSAGKANDAASYIEDGIAADLGLSSGTIWATRNLGAHTPYEPGNFYMWGSTEPIADAHPKDKGYCVSMNDITGSSSDAASKLLGDQWRLPSEEQVQELLDECDWKWTAVDGQYGYLVSGRSGQTLFLPAAGCVFLQGCKYVNEFGYYWTGARDPNDNKLAKELVVDMDKNNVKIVSGKQYVGRSIRPVYKKNERH